MITVNDYRYSDNKKQYLQIAASYLIYQTQFKNYLFIVKSCTETEIEKEKLYFEDRLKILAILSDRITANLKLTSLIQWEDNFKCLMCTNKMSNPIQ